MISSNLFSDFVWLAEQFFPYLGKIHCSSTHINNTSDTRFLPTLKNSSAPVGCSQISSDTNQS